MKCLTIVLAMAIAVGVTSCGNTSRPSPENRTYESASVSSSTETEKKEDDPYLENRLQTGATPYRNELLSGDQSTIAVKTSTGSECDVVVIVKHKGRIVRNAYIVAGDSYTFRVPNGTYQVFFYGGKGWKPDKSMRGGYKGGFVANESFSKDSAVSLNYQGVVYELILQPNGNFSTQPSDKSEMF